MTNAIEEAEIDIRNCQTSLIEARRVKKLLKELPDSIKVLEDVSISSSSNLEELSLTIVFHQSLTPDVDIVKVLKTEGVIGLEPTGAWNEKVCNFKGGKLITPSGQTIEFKVLGAGLPPTCHIEPHTKLTPVTTYKVVCNKEEEEVPA